MNRFLVQMHGYPGSGKTTLARALGAALPAVVIDKDVVASALIRSGIPFAEAGAPSYQVMYAQAARFLADGHSVVFDSPCFWPLIEETTRRIAAEASVTWCMVETQCSDELRDARLALRARLESNPAALERGPMRAGTYQPACERLVVDSSMPLEAMVSRTIAWVGDPSRFPRPVSGERLGKKQ